MNKYEFDEIDEKDLPIGFNNALEKRISRGNISEKKYRVTKSMKPDYTYEKRELLAILIENEGYFHNALSYYKDNPLNGDTKITAKIMKEISDKFKIWKIQGDNVHMHILNM